MSRTLTSKPGVDISEWVAESDTVMELCQRMAAYIHTYLPTYLSINQLINQSINLSIYQPINLSIYQSINLSIYQSINLSTYQSINQSIYLPTHCIQNKCGSICIHISPNQQIPAGNTIPILLATEITTWLSFPAIEALQSRHAVGSIGNLAGSQAPRHLRADGQWWIQEDVGESCEDQVCLIYYYSDMAVVNSVACISSFPHNGPTAKTGITAKSKLAVPTASKIRSTCWDEPWRLRPDQ